MFSIEYKNLGFNYEFNSDIKQLIKMFNTEKQLHKQSLSKIKKHILIMNSKKLMYEEEEKLYNDLVILDEKLNDFNDCFDKLITEINNNSTDVVDLNYINLFYDVENNYNLKFNKILLIGDVLLLFSLISELLCHNLNINIYQNNINKYELFSDNKLNINEINYPETIIYPRLSRVKSQISTIENFNIVARFSNLNLQGINYNKEAKKNKKFIEGINFLDPYNIHYN